MKKRTAAATSVAAGIGLMIAAPQGEIFYDYWFHTPTAQEEHIGSLVMDVYGTDTNVRCLPPEELVKRQLPVHGDPHQIRGYTITSWPNMTWLIDDVCQNIERFTRRPADTMLSLTPEEMIALKVLAHEVQHQKGVENESQADCQAVQEVYKIPEALGARETTAYMIGDAIAGVVALERADNTDAYRLSPECRPGGSFDLGEPYESFPEI